MNLAGAMELTMACATAGLVLGGLLGGPLAEFLIRRHRLSGPAEVTPAQEGPAAPVLPEDRVTVRTTNGLVRYRVSAVDVFRKQGLARNASRLFSQNGPAHLVLVTCAGWNGSRYLSNVVVVADPV